MKNKNIVVGESLEEISGLAVEKFLEVYSKKNGKIKVAFSGGKTPKLFLEKLADADLSWTDIEVFLVDERNVPITADGSNFKLLNQSLLANIEIPLNNIHSIPYFTNPSKSTMFFINDLKISFDLNDGEYPEFDFILLGIGDDGHTASLFPEIFDKNTIELAVTVTGLDRVPYDRISLSMNVINNCSNVVFLISGESKSEIVKKVFYNNDLNYPASHVNPQNKLFIFIDKEAAKMV